MLPGCNRQDFSEPVFSGHSLFFFFTGSSQKCHSALYYNIYSDGERETKLNQSIIALFPTLLKLAPKNQKYSHEYGFCILFQIIVKGNEKSWNNGDGNTPYTICSAIYYKKKKICSRGQ